MNMATFCARLTCGVTHFMAVSAIGLDIALVVGSSLDKTRGHAPYVVLVAVSALVGWAYVEVLLICCHRAAPENSQPLRVYSGDGLAAPAASVGLTAAAVWTTYRTKQTALDQYDIWVGLCYTASHHSPQVVQSDSTFRVLQVPLALGFQGAALSVFAKVARKMGRQNDGPRAAQDT